MSWATWDGTGDGQEWAVATSTGFSYLAHCGLSATRTLIAFHDYGSPGEAKVGLLAVSGTTVSIPDLEVFDADGAESVSICALSETQALICWRNETDNYGHARVVTISSDTISLGTAITFSPAAADYVRVCALSSSTALVCFEDQTTPEQGYYTAGKACVLSVSGSTVTAGTPANFQPQSTQEYTTNIAVTALSDSAAVVSYRCLYGYACFLSISGTTVTAGSPVAFNSDDNTVFVQICTMSASAALVVYRGYGGSGATQPLACVLAISGTTITPGTPSALQTHSVSNGIGICKLSATQALLVYSRTDWDTSTDYFYGCVLTVSGGSVSSGSLVLMKTADIFPEAPVLLSESDVLAVYYDSTNVSTYLMIAKVLVGGAEQPLAQEGFRFVNDDGDEDASTFAANQDTNVYMLAGAAARIRLLLDAVGDPAAAQYQLEFRYKPSGGAFGAWGKVKSVVTDGGVVVTDGGVPVYD